MPEQNKPERDKLHSLKKLKQVKADALATVEVTIRMTTHQYRMLATLAKHDDVTAEAYASIVVANFTHLGYKNRGLDDEDRGYLSDKLGF